MSELNIRICMDRNSGVQKQFIADTEQLQEELKFLKDTCNNVCVIVYRKCDKPVQESEDDNIRSVTAIPFHGPATSHITCIDTAV